MVKKLMSDEDIIKDLGEDPHNFNIDEFAAMKKIKKRSEVERDPRSLL